METIHFRDLTRIYMLIAGAFCIVFFTRWVIIGYIVGGVAQAFICGAGLFIFLIIGIGALYVGLERYDSFFSPAPPPIHYYPTYYYNYPQMPYYPLAYGPYYPFGYYPPAGMYHPPPSYDGRQPAYQPPLYYQYGYYPQYYPYPGPAVESPRTAAGPPQYGPAQPQSSVPATGPVPTAQPTSPQGSVDEMGNRRPLRLPSASILLRTFLVAIIVGGLSLAFAVPSGYISLLIFPFAFIIGFSFPSLIWISYVYSFEKREPRPSKSILVAFTWGMLSTIPALMVNTAAASILGADGPNPSIMASLLTVALVAPIFEELSKPWGVLLVREEVRSRLDGLIFGVTCGVGFALIENISYEVSFALTGQNPAAVWTIGALARGLGSIMVHAAGAGLIGYAYGRYRLMRGSSFWAVPIAYGLAVSLHAAWNGASVILPLLPVGDYINIAFIPLFALGAFYLLKHFLDRGAASELEPGGYLSEARY
jgi:RsiW-degrading membrane proteinase PrsW (M82 family)